MKGVCLLAAVPMRSQPSDRAEMVNQLIFGDTFELVDRQEKWTMIRCDGDGYEGWVDNKQYVKVNASQYQRLQEWSADGVTNGSIIVENSMVPLTMGCRYPQRQVRKFRLAGMQVQPLFFESAGPLLDAAKLMLGTPYLWGGRTFMGIDCSGFVQVVFLSQGIQLQRDASQQARQGIAVASLDKAKPEDLCFFQNDEGRIVHVGIYMGEGEIIHASGQVRMDRLDSQGIYNERLRAYTHRLHSIRRIRK